MSFIRALVLVVLAATAIAPQSITATTSQTPLADNRELRRLRIDEARPPADVPVVTRPVGLWEGNRQIILIAGGVLSDSQF